VRLSHSGGTGLRAFGLQVLYAPSFDTVAADAGSEFVQIDLLAVDQ